MNGKLAGLSLESAHLCRLLALGFEGVFMKKFRFFLGVASELCDRRVCNTWVELLQCFRCKSIDMQLFAGVLSFNTFEIKFSQWFDKAQ